MTKPKSGKCSGFRSKIQNNLLLGNIPLPGFKTKNQPVKRQFAHLIGSLRTYSVFKSSKAQWDGHIYMDKTVFYSFIGSTNWNHQSLSNLLMVPDKILTILDARKRTKYLFNADQTRLMFLFPKREKNCPWNIFRQEKRVLIE